MKCLRIIFALVVLAVVARSALAASSQVEASEIYHQYCSVCHGDRGDGRSRARQGLIPPPRDFTAPGLAGNLSRSRMIDSVLNGRAGTAMVGWRTRLTLDQAEAVVDYMRSNFMNEVTPERTAKQDSTSAQATHANPPAGNIAVGRILYDANCVACHGVEGKGNGPRAYFISPPPRDFTSAAFRLALKQTRMVDAVRDGVQGREMPAWGKVFTDQQIADVCAYVYHAFLKPGSNAADTR